MESTSHEIAVSEERYLGAQNTSIVNSNKKKKKNKKSSGKEETALATRQKMELEIDIESRFQTAKEQFQDILEINKDLHQTKISEESIAQIFDDVQIANEYDDLKEPFCKSIDTLYAHVKNLLENESERAKKEKKKQEFMARYSNFSVEKITWTSQSGSKSKSEQQSTAISTKASYKTVTTTTTTKEIQMEAKVATKTEKMQRPKQWADIFTGESDQPQPMPHQKIQSSQRDTQVLKKKVMKKDPNCNYCKNGNCNRRAHTGLCGAFVCAEGCDCECGTPECMEICEGHEKFNCNNIKEDEQGYAHGKIYICDNEAVKGKKFCKKACHAQEHVPNGDNRSQTGAKKRELGDAPMCGNCFSDRFYAGGGHGDYYRN